jgi:hypothetical protein
LTLNSFCVIQALKSLKEAHMRKHIAWILTVVTSLVVSIAPRQAAAAEVKSDGSQVSAPNQNERTARAAGKAPVKVKLGPLQASPQIVNPAASGSNAAIIAVLQRQKQGADAEAAQMKLSIHPAGQKGLPAGPSQTMSATGGGRTGAPATAPAQTAVPGTTKASNPSANPAVVHAQAPSLALACGNDPTMRIATVSGQAGPATFTSDPQYNFYTITGCSFGDPGPNAKAWIYYTDQFHQDFQIQEWNDNGIKLNLNPNVRGLLDHDNLTLVVQRADGHQVTKSGFKFYAARESQRLTFFPKDQFGLWQFTANDISHLSPQYASPSSLGTPDGGQPGVTGYAAEVFWTCSNCGAVKGRFVNTYMQGNEDVWKMEKLQPGFVLESYGLGHRDLDCSGFAGIQKEGSFGLKLVGNDLHAQWQGQTCINNACGGFGQADCFDYSGSNYFMNINVSGPRGVDPWTGKAN